MNPALAAAMTLAWILSPNGTPESFLGVHAIAPTFEDEGLEDEELRAGLLVSSVVENSPAAQAGLLAGDRVLALDGVRPRTPQHLEAIVAALEPGSPIRISARREERILEFSTSTVPRLLPAPAAESRGLVESRRMGVIARSLSAEESRREGLPRLLGVRIDRIFRESPLAGGDLQEGDIVLEVDRRAVYGAEDFLALVSRLEPGVRTKVFAWREGRPFRVYFTTHDPEAYVSRVFFPILVSYRNDPRKESTSLSIFLGLFGYEAKEDRSSYSFLWFWEVATGTNEELEEVAP